MSFHPAIGRWVQTDPDGYVDGLNPYEAERSNPINRTDAFGLKSIYISVHSRRDQHARDTFEDALRQGDGIKFKKTLESNVQKALAALKEVDATTFENWRDYKNGGRGVLWDNKEFKGSKADWEKRVNDQTFSAIKQVRGKYSDLLDKVKSLKTQGYTIGILIHSGPRGDILFPEETKDQAEVLKALRDLGAVVATCHEGGGAGEGHIAKQPFSQNFVPVIGKERCGLRAISIKFEAVTLK